MTEQEFNEKLQKAKVLFDEKINADSEKSVPFANYIASKKSGNTIYISGQLPRDLLDENKIITGKAIENDNILNLKDKYEKGSFDAVTTNPPYKQLNTGIVNENSQKLAIL